MTSLITQIYLDLDGVLADFDRGVEQILGKALEGIGWFETWL